MKYTLEKLNKWLLIILILIQPLMNIIRNVFINDIQFLGFSVFEMINILLVLSSTVITIYLYKDRSKFWKYLIFLILFIIYSIFHYINIMHFNAKVYEQYNPNFFSETYYLFRTFVISLLLILNIYYSNIKKQTLIRVVEMLSLTISVVIVLSNIFKIGFLSYGNGICKLNIFDWFTFKSTHSYSYYAITCKGWFSSANQISSILFMTLPIILYLAYRKRCLFNYIVLILHSLAMFMLGTKTANLGVMLVYGFFILLYIVLKLLKKVNHSVFTIVAIFATLCLILLYSPYYHNVSYNANRASTFEKIEKEGDNIDDIKDEDLKKGFALFKKIKKYDCANLTNEEQSHVIEFYHKHKSYLGISKYIIDNYKVENHTNFWCNYIFKYSSNDYRDLKTNILKNIYTENSNNMDKYFGLGYSLNYIYTESDYSYQYYIYGIFGLLLFISPYFFILIFLGIHVLKNFKNKFNLENCMYLLGPILSLTIAYYSGHVLERTFPLLIMSLLVGLNLINLKKSSEEVDKVMIVADCDDKDELVLKFKRMFNNYDYRIITTKKDNIWALKKVHGRKVEYLIASKKRLLNRYIVYCYNLFKLLYIYIRFNPRSVIISSNKMAKTLCYIGKIFGSKIVFINPLVNTSLISKNLISNEYVFNYTNSKTDNKVVNIEKEIIEKLNSTKKV